MAKGQRKSSSGGTFSKRGGYESGSKKVTDLKPPPKNVGAGVKSNGVSSKK